MDDAFTEYRSGYIVMEEHSIVELNRCDESIWRKVRQKSGWMQGRNSTSWIRERSYALRDDSVSFIRRRLPRPSQTLPHFH